MLCGEGHSAKAGTLALKDIQTSGATGHVERINAPTSLPSKRLTSHQGDLLIGQTQNEATQVRFHGHRAECIKVERDEANKIHSTEFDSGH